VKDITRARSEHRKKKLAVFYSGKQNTQDFYELDKVLGEGAFARVYLARGKATGTEYAVKVVEKVPEELQFIAIESRIASTIFHPGIVRT